MSSSSRVAIIGAGLTGLAAGYRLKELGYQVSIFDSASTPGGLIKSSIDDSWLADSGYGIINQQSEVVTRLINNLGLRDEVLDVRHTHTRRYVAYNGRLRRIPNSVSAAIFSGYLPLNTRLRLLFSRFVKRQPLDNDTLASFVERFLGPAAVPLIAEPLATILFAGNEQMVSVKHSMPTLYEKVAQKKSLVRGLKSALKSRGNSLKSPAPIAFRMGMQTLTGAMANAMEDQIFSGARVVQVKRHQGQWLLTLYIGEEARYFLCDHVIFAIPAYSLGEILIDDAVDPLFADVAKMPYAPLTVLNMGFKRADLDHKLDSAGFVVRRTESNSILGVQFTSSLIEERAPGGHHLLSVFVGGVNNADFAKEPINKIKTTVLKDLNRYLGVKAYPQYVKSFAYPKAIPQFDDNYEAIEHAIGEIEAKYPGFHLIGQYRFGVGIVRCIEQSFITAENLYNSGKSSESTTVSNDVE